MARMQHVPTIAIVGRPNVGKSAIFNRMAGRRIAIVHDEPGVTRDRLSAPCKITDRACKIMDTGGIGARLTDGFAEQVAAEADIAMKTADLILFVLDCRDHLTPIDQSIADHLRKSDVPVILLLNKADHEKQDRSWLSRLSAPYKVFGRAARCPSVPCRSRAVPRWHTR